MSNPHIPEALELIERDMVFVEGGAFMRGGERFDDEKPIHQVTLKDFSIQRYPLSQHVWTLVMGENPAGFPGRQRSRRTGFLGGLPAIHRQTQ